MAERQATRNEAIASAFARMPVGEIPGSGNRAFFMERRGDGVSIILRTTRALAGRLPEYRVLAESDLFLTLPAAETVATPGMATVSVHEDGRPVSGADVLARYPSGSWKRGSTDERGQVRFDLYSKTRPMTIFVAASCCSAHLERDWIPAHGDLAVPLRPLESGGSAILARATDRVPGFEGRLKPQRDVRGRTFLYADGMSINEGQTQPVHFTPREELRLTDPFGVSMIVCVVEVLGDAALVEYRTAPPGG